MRVGILLSLESIEDVRAAINALVALNLHYMRENPDAFPSIYEAGIRYVREDPSEEREAWQTAPMLLARGEGDCEDLACYTTARYISRGVAAEVGIFRTPAGYHIVTILPDGSVEDPSARTGMLQL